MLMPRVALHRIAMGMELPLWNGMGPLHSCRIAMGMVRSHRRAMATLFLPGIVVQQDGSHPIVMDRVECYLYAMDARG